MRAAAEPGLLAVPARYPQRPLTSTVVWTIPDLPDDEFVQLEILQFGTVTPQTVTLFPVDGEINVSVYHTEALLPGGSGGHDFGQIPYTCMGPAQSTME